jgi:hypothetical protein
LQEEQHQDRKYQEAQPAAPRDRPDEEPAAPVSPPRSAQVGRPPSAEEEWWAEPQPANVLSPVSESEEAEDDTSSESDEQDRALDGLLHLAESKTRWGRVRRLVSRLPRNEK